MSNIKTQIEGNDYYFHLRKDGRDYKIHAEFGSDELAFFSCKDDGISTYEDDQETTEENTPPELTARARSLIHLKECEKLVMETLQDFEEIYSPLGQSLVKYELFMDLLAGEAIRRREIAQARIAAGEK